MATEMTLGKQRTQKRLWAWVPNTQHARVKAHVALRGRSMESWVAEAVAEKLAREEGKVRPFPGTETES